MSVNETDLVIDPGSRQGYLGWILLNWGSSRTCRVAFPVTNQLNGKRKISTWITESEEL